MSSKMFLHCNCNSLISCFFVPLFSWVSLDEEMRQDVQRIWKRNMGRDDRCISDHGKEVISVIFVESECSIFLNFSFGFRLLATDVYYCPLHARFPFLDENVIKTLLEIPLWEMLYLMNLWERAIRRS